jgi:O-antigen/teichoic acid export membrane protein
MENQEKNNKELDTSLKLIVKSSFIFFVGIIISKVLTYVFRVIIARYLHSEVYGLFSIASAITDCLTTVFALGLGAGLIRYISIYRGKKELSKINHLIKTSLIVVTFSGIIGGLFLFLISKYLSVNIFHDQNLIIFLKWFSIVIPFAVFSSIFINTLLAFEKIQLYSFVRNILYNIVELAVLIFLVLIGFGVNSLIFSYLAGALSLVISSFIFCKYALPSVFKKYSLNKDVKKQLNKELFSYSWPLIFLGLINFVFYSTDTFLIGYFQNASQVGIYNVAVPIASLLLIVPGLFILLFLPLITKEFARKN